MSPVTQSLSRKAAHAPPIGFRKAISMLVKLKVVLRQDGKCFSCNDRLGDLGDIQFDHIPALGIRCWDPDIKDTIPPANDEASIFAKHTECHKQKTTGRKGESKLSKVGGDISEIAKIRRLTKEQEAFQKRLLSKDDPDRPAPEIRESPKAKWPTRKFTIRRKHKKEAQS